LVMNDRHGVALTISDAGYIGLLSVTLLDFTKPWEHTETILKLLPLGAYQLPADSSSGVSRYQDRRLLLEFTVTAGQRHLVCNCQSFKDNQPFTCDITLRQPAADTMVIATPWANKPQAFYYNQKINCLPASGRATWGEHEYVFKPTDAFGTLDWGRGVWTYDNTWYWSSGNAWINGRPFGFNLGYGFGDTTAASENMLFYDHRGHKLDDVVMHIPGDSYLKPWQITSSDDRFSAEFAPVLDRAARINLGVILTDQHQVFGRLNGRAVLDDGKVLALRDIMCFAEHVRMKY